MKSMEIFHDYLTTTIPQSTPKRRLRFAPLLRWKTPSGVEAVFEQILRFEGGRTLCPDMAGNYVLADRTGRLYAGADDFRKNCSNQDSGNYISPALL